MSNLHVKYLLVGGGLASSSAASAIRAIDPQGTLLIVGQEIHRPYHRPPLSKEAMRRSTSRHELFTVEPQWFAENSIDLRTGCRAAQLDPSRQSVTLDNGEEIAFDKLLIATGGSAQALKIPGADLPNVFYLRTLGDLDRLHIAIDKAKNEGRAHSRGRGHVAVIGGGLLGVELAANLNDLGLAVDLVVGASHPWRKFAGETTGKFISRFLENSGVRVFADQRAERIEGDGRVQRVILTDGTSVQTDFVIAAVGMAVNKDLIRGTSIAAEKAILTDTTCRTSEPNIYAAGDCAAIYDPLFGKHRILDHWDSAVTTGTLAGKNMAGVETHYSTVNHFFSDIGSLHLRAWGEAKLVNHRLIRGSPNVDIPDFAEIGVAADGRIAQILCIGDGNDDEVLKRLVERRVKLNGNEERIKDPQFDLANLLD